MNKKFWASFGVIIVTLSGLFYVMQNCGREDDFLDQRSISNVFDGTNNTDQTTNEPQEEVEMKNIPVEEQKAAMALLVDCSGVKAEDWAENQVPFNLEESQALCKKMSDLKFSETKGNNAEVNINFEQE